MNMPSGSFRIATSVENARIGKFVDVRSAAPCEGKVMESVEFREQPTSITKRKRWRAYHKDGHHILGFVAWREREQQYIFSPRDPHEFTFNQLRDIAEFIEAQTTAL